MASNILNSNNSSNIQKQLAGSVLSQVNQKNQTSAKLETVASKALNSNKYNADTKQLAGSVLSQANKER
jgi:hypothetical protein